MWVNKSAHKKGYPGVLTFLDNQEEILNLVLDWISDFDFAFEEKPADPMDDLQNTSKQDAFNQLKQTMEQGGFFNNFWR